jgi:hypothetical protein
MLNLTQEHTEEHKIIFKMLTDNGIVLRKHLKLMEEHHDLMEIQHEMVKNCTNIIKNK